jgi:hypothetical protein
MLNLLAAIALGCGVECGDANEDGDINGADIVAIVDCSTVTGDCIPEADVNGDGSFDLADAVYLAAFLFLSGPELVCPDPTAIVSADYFSHKGCKGQGDWESGESQIGPNTFTLEHHQPVCNDYTGCTEWDVYWTVQTSKYLQKWRVNVNATVEYDWNTECYCDEGLDQMSTFMAGAIGVRYETPALTNSWTSLLDSIGWATSIQYGLDVACNEVITQGQKIQHFVFTRDFTVCGKPNLIMIDGLTVKYDSTVNDIVNQFVFDWGVVYLQAEVIPLEW